MNPRKGRTAGQRKPAVKWRLWTAGFAQRGVVTSEVGEKVVLLLLMQLSAGQIRRSWPGKELDGRDDAALARLGAGPNGR